MILGDRGKREKKSQAVVSQRRSLLAWPVPQQEGQERSPALPLCLSLSSPPTTLPLCRRTLRLLGELGTCESPETGHGLGGK